LADNFSKDSLSTSASTAALLQSRLNQNDVNNRVNVELAAEVRDEIGAIFAARYPEADLSALARVFADIDALFEGRYPGYLRCDTLYHDLRHTLNMTLATARLIEGHDRVASAPERMGARRAILGVVIALLHDSGYLKRVSESGVENGAIFTKVHVSRSADFLARFLPTVGYAAEAPLAARLVHFTGEEMDVDDIKVDDPRDRLLGCMVGTADLIGQMSDRMYLEKCREYLYREFVYGAVARETLPDGREIVRYASPEDLIYKTPGFYEYVARDRIHKKLDSADRFAEVHFGGENRYQTEIDRNMHYLKESIERADLARLRRSCYSLSETKARHAA